MFYIDFIFKWGLPKEVFNILTLQKRKGKALKLGHSWQYDLGYVFASVSKWKKAIFCTYYITRKYIMWYMVLQANMRAYNKNINNCKSSPLFTLFKQCFWFLWEATCFFGSHACNGLHSLCVFSLVKTVPQTTCACLKAARSRISAFLLIVVD